MGDVVRLAPLPKRSTGKQDGPFRTSIAMADLMRQIEGPQCFDRQERGLPYAHRQVTSTLPQRTLKALAGRGLVAFYKSAGVCCVCLTPLGRNVLTMWRRR